MKFDLATMMANATQAPQSTFGAQSFPMALNMADAQNARALTPAAGQSDTESSFDEILNTGYQSRLPILKDAIDEYQRQHRSSNPDQAFFYAASRHPVNLDASYGVMRDWSGNASVTDPEGRTGNPLFVAGTQPDGTNIPMNDATIGFLANSIGNVKPTHGDGATRGLTNYPGQYADPNYSGVSTTLNLDNGAMLPPGRILAHEVGHSVHFNQNRVDDALDGASPMAMAEMEAMRSTRPYTGHGDQKEWMAYARSAPETFAEAFRAYVSDPAGFKRSYPNAARFLRDRVNSDPRLNRFLMLSQNDSEQFG